MAKVAVFLLLVCTGCKQRITAPQGSGTQSFYDEVESKPGVGMTILKCANGEYCVRNSQMKTHYWKALATLNCAGGTCVCDKLAADKADPDFDGVFVDCPSTGGGEERARAQEMLQLLFSSKKYFGDAAITTINPTP